MRRACARAAMWAHAMRFVWLRPGAACESLRVCRTCSAPHDVRAWENSAGRGQRHRRCAVGCASQPIDVESASPRLAIHPPSVLRHLRRAVVVPSMHGPARTVPARPDARTQASTHAARHARWGESATRRVQTRAANGRSADARLSAPRVPVCERACRPCMCGAVHGVMEGQGDRGCDSAFSGNQHVHSRCYLGRFRHSIAPRQWTTTRLMRCAVALLLVVVRACVRACVRGVRESTAQCNIFVGGRLKRGARAVPQGGADPSTTVLHVRTRAASDAWD